MPRTICWLLVLFMAGCAAPAPDAPAELLGAWQGDALARFDAEKCYLYDNGKLDIFAARYPSGQIVLSSWGQTMIWNMEVKDDVLTLRSTDGKLKLQFRRLKNVPAELEVRAKTLRPPQPVAAERQQVIVKELARRKVIDQAVRLDPAQQKNQPKVDADNYAYLMELIKEVGWIDATRFGPDATVAAFLIAQHSGDLGLLLAIRPLIEADAQAGRIGKGYLASIHDRVQIMQADRQRYGTQLGRNAQGDMLVLALEDRAKVDDFRKEMGLPPLADYLEDLRRRHGWKIRFEED